MRVIGSVEARMGSTRLPGKTLMPVWDGMSLLECVVRRFRLCTSLQDVVVATTTVEKDRPIADWCDKNGVKFYRGSENDVLDRVVGAAKSLNADAIAQMGADSAYLDFQLIDDLVSIFKGGDYDYVCNDMKLTFPLGIYGHIVRVSTLETLNRRTDLSSDDRVDVVRYIFERPAAFKIRNIEAPEGYRCPDLRLTIDYPEDLDQAREVYARFHGFRFTTRDLLELYRQQPEMFSKTKHLIQQSAPHLRTGK